MKQFLAIFCLVGGVLGMGNTACGQTNLIPNPSFEAFQHCPVSFTPKGKIELVHNWKQPTTGTVDYYNSCSKSVGVPSNIFGWQMAAEGEGYLGIVTYSPTKRNYREYIQAELTQSLVANKLYCVEFYVSQADYSNYLCDGIGLYFSKTRVTSQDDKVLPMPAQLSNPIGHVLHHSKNWILISNVFKATGGEKFITIGNFKPDHQVTAMFRNLNKDTIDRIWNYGYYYIDKLSLKPIKSVNECECTVPNIKKMLKDPGYPFDYVQMDRMEIDNVLFAFDKSTLSKEAKKRLNKVVVAMTKYSSYYLEVHGHTDLVGPDGYNSGLSEARAQKVYQYLIDSGIDAKRLRIKYFGETTPAIEGESPEANKKNRRVEFVLLQL